MTEPGNLADILDEYLRALEAGSPPDRDALLARHPDLADELEAALLGVDFVYSAAPRLAPEEHADALPGRSLGDFRLLRELGRGGMAVVYEAEQVSLGRRVALKVLPFAAVLDPKQLQRFKNEAMAAAHLHHANIVPVYGVGCERGVHYYAMQFVEGQSLATAIRELKVGGMGEGPRTPISSHGSNREPAYIRMAAQLGVQAAEALDHAHQLGIVHRDVKPGNLLVDQAGAIWVTDFGVASSVANVGLTMTGELLGTIRYMSPEQALAKRAPIDHRTDVYSLGATLYEFFTLEPAFPGDDPHVVIHDIATKDPVLPSRLNPAIPSDLETVLLKAMSKEPANRYATALEMAEDLTHFLENRPIEAKRPGFLRRASKWSRRHRTLVAATVAMLMLSTAGLATGTALLWREQAQTEAAFGSAQANLNLALQALDQIYIDEAETHPKVREGLPRDLLQKGLGFYEAFVKVNARNKGVVILMASAYQRAGLIFRALGEEVRAVEHLNRAILAYDQALENDPRDTRATHNRGVALSGLGRFEEALAAHARTLEIDPRDVDARNSRGAELCDHLGRPGEALAEFDRAVALDQQNALSHMNRGNALRRLERFEEALAAFDRAIGIDPENAGVHTGRALVLHDLGRFEAALAACDRAIDIDQRHSLAHAARGLTLMSLRRFEEALAASDRVLDINPGNAAAHNLRGNALLELGRFAQALAAYDRALEIEPRDASFHSNRGLALAAKGEFDAAIGAHREAIRLLPDDAKAYFILGSTLGQKGELEAAIRAYREAIRLDASFFEAHFNLGVTLVANGEVEAAIVAYREAARLKPDLAVAHYSLGHELAAIGEVEAAIVAYREAIRLDPDYAEAHCNLGHSLSRRGRFQEAVPSFRRGHELGSGRTDWAYDSGTWIEVAEQKAEVEGRLDQVLSGNTRPRDAKERFEFAVMLYEKTRHAESARMFVEAFADDATLAEDLATNLRYYAACSAALTAAAGGADAAEWRGRALEWLRADLAAREKAATGLAAMLEHWKKDPDLENVHGRLADLPEPERDAWRGLWAAVDLALATALPAEK